MSKIKIGLKNAISSLPNRSKIKLYWRRYHEKMSLLSGLWEWIQWKCQPQKEDIHDAFLDYSEGQDICTVEQLIEMLSDFDVVSFDIFDTLLFRQVANPTDVFSLMEQRMGLSGFASYRKKAESEARQAQHEKNGSWEVSFPQIYERMTKYSREQRTELQKLELFLEKEQLFANPVMRQAVEGLYSKGITLLAISDMYLDSDTLSQLLQGCGFPVFQKIYVSSEAGVSKSDGRIFQRVSQLEHWQGKRIAHIGDNFYSDVRSPTEQGIMGIHYIR